MVTIIKINSLDDLMYIQNIARKFNTSEIYINSIDDKKKIDAKSFIGLFSLNFSEPIKFICEDKKVHNYIKFLGE